LTALPARWRVTAALALAVLFWQPLLFGGSLRLRDWAFHLHYYDWIRTALREYSTLPLLMPDALHTQNFVANAQSPLGPLVWLLALMPADAYVKLLIVLYTAAGLFGMFTLLSDLRVGPTIALVATLAFALGGFFVSHISVGHHWALGVYLLPGIACAYRRAVLGSRPALWAGAALGCIALLEGQHHPWIWQNAFLALFAILWALQQRSWLPVRTWALIAAAGAGLAAVKLVPMVLEFADYEPIAQVAGFPPRLLLWTLATPRQTPDTVSAGIGWTAGSRWWEYAFYIGAPACGFIVVGLLAAGRRCWPLLLTGAAFLALCLDLSAWHPALDLWSRVRQLPIVGSQRVPSRFLAPALFAALVAASVGAQRLWMRWRHHRIVAPGLRLTMAALLLWTAVDLYAAARPWEEDAGGDPLPSKPHQLALPVLRGPGSGSVALERFHPNRLLYRVATSGLTFMVLPLDYRHHHGHWRAEDLDLVGWRGQLAVTLPPGERLVELSYHPRGLRLGLAVSVVTLGLAVWTLARRRD